MQDEDIYSVQQSIDMLKDTFNKHLTDVLNQYGEIVFGMPPAIDKQGKPIAGRKPDFSRLNKLLSMYL